MNTFVFSIKMVDYESSDMDEVFVINTKMSLEEVNDYLDSYLKNFKEEFKILLDNVNSANSKLTSKDFDDENSPKVKLFEEAFAKQEAFLKKNEFLEIEGQFIEVCKFFWDYNELNFFKVETLDDWVKNKNKELKVKKSKIR